MSAQLQKLPWETQEILKLAACIGNQFDLNILAIVSEKSEIETATNLWTALQSGLVVPQTEIYKFYQGEPHEQLGQENKTQKQLASYKFLHDRVQQAAYSLIPEEQKQVTHLRIGQLLLNSLSPQEKQERIFDLANQLNLGKAAISNSQEQQQLAWLNLQAGEKAKLSSAYQAAENYCTIGIGLLPIETWQTDYKLIYNLYRYGSEAAYLCGNFEGAEALYKEALTHAQTPLDKAVIYRLQMTQYQLQGRNREAIDIQRQSLQLLGWEMPTEAEQVQANLDAEIATVNGFLAQHTVKSILHFSKMTDDSIAEILRILQILFYAALLDGQSTLALLAVAKMTTLSLQYGNSDMSPFAYVGYGLIANVMLKEFSTAYQLGNMAVQLCEQFDNADIRGMTNFLFAADVHSWSHPIREADTYYDNAYKYSMEAGNWLTVGFMMMQSGSDRLTYGKNIDELYVIAQTHADFLRHIKSLENLDALIVGVIQPIRNLLGLTKTPFTFDDDSFSESEYLQKYSHVPYHLAWLYSVKIRHAYLFDCQTAYPDLISKLSIIENTIPSHAKVPSSVFYVALMHLSLVEIAKDEQERQFHLQTLITLEKKLDYWKTACPENILHKCLILQAEKARLNREKSEAIDLYEQAINAAQTNEYGYEEGLANELAAKFYLNWGKEKVASGYMQEAYYCYAKWGATAKTYDLEKRYPQLLQPILQQKRINLNPWETIGTFTFAQISSSAHTSTSSTSINDTFDFASTLKAAQAISSSLELDELITNLTQIILENSGAKKAALILSEENTWQVRAITAINHQNNSPNYTQSILKPQLLDNCQALPTTIINYVKNTQETIVIDDCQTNISGVIGEYMLTYQPKSVLCTPILDRGNLVGILYLENQITSGVFTNERLQVINLLSSQAAISLLNARLYQQSQQALQDLQQAQLQIVQSEKMSALGNLVAGVAHEMNNPLGFISATLKQTKTTFMEISQHLQLCRQKITDEEIIDHAEEIDLDYSLEDLPKMLDAMVMACDRLKNISTSFRTFSRADKDYKVKFNLHEGIDSTILILKHRLKANEQRPAIEVVTDYGDLPQIDCFPGQLNQVFMNILANAIDALDESNTGCSFEEIKTNPNTIRIQTSVEDNYLKISISDNGKGMSQEIQQKIFDHLFTTKAVGKGTGLGLAIAKQIIEETHGGKLSCNSVVDGGTEFAIKIPL